ncbi:MAG: L-rhamnose mutarotase, partial [Verrucomicrobiae bacterium]|nr:L-rhamnose mutarotase [Verrucomicrobiae bacterium]
EALYKKRHDEIWPEILQLMDRQGVRTFSIYRYGLKLFAYQERDTAFPRPDRPEAIAWKWWAYMAPLMEVNPDTSPVSEALEEAFHYSDAISRTLSSDRPA